MNKTAHAVRQRARPGPGDRRVRRTRQALTHALVDLVLEGRYDAITIQDLLDGADIGRSTFYSHYRGKDDLLLRSFERMLDGLDQAWSGMARRTAASRRSASFSATWGSSAASTRRWPGHAWWTDCTRSGPTS